MRNEREIANLRGLYTKYFNRLEEIWINLESDTSSIEECSRSYFSVKSELGEEIQSIDNKLHINGKIKTIYQEAEKEANKYLTTRY